MHQYAKTYKDHKTQLRQAYKEMKKQNTPDHKFEPIINPKSIKIAQDNQKSFTDRTMDMYINKHKRRDKDPDEIEYEKS